MKFLFFPILSILTAFYSFAQNNPPELFTQHPSNDAIAVTKPDDNALLIKHLHDECFLGWYL